MLGTNIQPTAAQLASIEASDSEIYLLEETTELRMKRTFVLSDIEETKQILEFVHKEKDANGTIHVILNGQNKSRYDRTLNQLAQEPIRFYLDMKSQTTLVEYYCGLDNPGCHLKVNGKPHGTLPSGPEYGDPPEFQRGPIRSDFSGPVKKTECIIYAGEDEVALRVLLTWNKKNRVLSLKSDDKH